ncbi:unnamed protein product [Auanema sp. JU1783]|nr:unnamed protein product [Auanema sp. JU1783]
MSETLSESAQSISVDLSLDSLQKLKDLCETTAFTKPPFRTQCSRPSKSNNSFSLNISDLANKSSLSVCPAPSTTNCINRRMDVMRTMDKFPPLCMSRESSSKEIIIEKRAEKEDMEPQLANDNNSIKGRPRKRPTSTSPQGAIRLYKNHSLNVPYDVSPEKHRLNVLRLKKALNRTQAAELRFSYIAEHVLKSLSEYGWSVVDNFLGADHCRNVNNEIQVLESRGLFSAGQLVEAKNMDEQHVKDIRSDKTYWFSGSDQRSADASTVRMLINYLDSLVNKFSDRLLGQTIFGRSKAMLAIYPGYGSRYVKHVDNPAKDGRRITVIYYCNPGWDSKDGGVLRLYPDSSNTPFDIEPRADRLLFFWSDNRIPHEVMPVYKDRYAITVWYMDRSEREEYFKRSKMSTGSTPSSASSTSAEDIPRNPSEPRDQRFRNGNVCNQLPHAQGPMPVGVVNSNPPEIISNSTNGNGNLKTSTPSISQHDKQFNFSLTSLPLIPRQKESPEETEKPPTSPAESSDLTPEYLI